MSLGLPSDLHGRKSCRCETDDPSGPWNEEQKRRCTSKAAKGSPWKEGVSPELYQSYVIVSTKSLGVGVGGVVSSEIKVWSLSGKKGESLETQK